MRRLVSVSNVYVVHHSRRNAGGATGGGWHTTIRRKDGSWSDSFDTRTRWGAERKAARLAFASECTTSAYDPEAPYEFTGEIEI